jgi:porphobilinogen synthase
LRTITSNHTQHAWLKHHMAMPAVIRLQKRRVCPRLSKAFLAETMNAAAITSSGIKSPIATRNKGLGNTTGARTKASSRPTPQRINEMWGRDTTLHHMTFATICLDHGLVTGGYYGNVRPGLSGFGRRLLELRVMAFPANRLRRLRRTETLRALVRETRLTPESLVYPLFICPGTGIRKEVRSMPGVFNLSIDEAVKEVREAHALGVSAVILFGLPEKKDEVATGAWAEDGIVQKAARAIKSEVGDVVVMGDVCLCEYMSHGHCGIVKLNEKMNEKVSVKSGPQSLGAAAAAAPPATAEYEIVNDATLELLARTSVSLARSGVDIIAPSDMMDGRVAAIRVTLDQAGFENTPILSYAAKFSSGFYGPFREAADSAPQFGDRRSYQMDPANLREAMREIELDIEEGADMIMVKPAMPYLDVIAAARDRFDLPLAAYQVSGEYAMIEAAARNQWIDRERVMMESLLCIRRAGASMILTYYAKEAAKLLA